MYSLVAQNQKNAVESADLHSRWNRLSREFEELWENMYDESAQERLRQLEGKAEELSKGRNRLSVLQAAQRTPARRDSVL
ncbi:MAG: hypothetical protein HY235_10000 [Acidobacteria bacterium]|nr:hypothetical protein [Acidobacteriota bacterium]